jgi:ferredoxin
VKLKLHALAPLNAKLELWIQCVPKVDLGNEIVRQLSRRNGMNGRAGRGGVAMVVKVVSESCPEVEISRCTGCGRCVSACPERLFTLEVSGYRKHALLRSPERCTLCLECLAACPVGALKR